MAIPHTAGMRPEKCQIHPEKWQVHKERRCEAHWNRPRGRIAIKCRGCIRSWVSHKQPVGNVRFEPVFGIDFIPPSTRHARRLLFAPGLILSFMKGFVELEPVRKDDEFVLQRCEHSDQPGSPSVLLLTPASTRPTIETLRKLQHECSLRDQLDSAWAVRPLTLAEHRGNPALVLEDPGGETLDRLLAGPMEIKQFLRFAVGLARALTGLHKSGLIHKDLKPANVLVAPATG